MAGCRNCEPLAPHALNFILAVSLQVTFAPNHLRLILLLTWSSMNRVYWLILLHENVSVSFIRSSVMRDIASSYLSSNTLEYAACLSNILNVQYSTFSSYLLYTYGSVSFLIAIKCLFFFLADNR